MRHRQYPVRARRWLAAKQLGLHFDYGERIAFDDELQVVVAARTAVAGCSLPAYIVNCLQVVIDNSVDDLLLGDVQTAAHYPVGAAFASLKYLGAFHFQSGWDAQIA